MFGPIAGGFKALSTMLIRITLQRMEGMFFQLLFCPEKFGTRTRHAFEGALMPFSVSPQRKVMVG